MNNEPYSRFIIFQPVMRATYFILRSINRLIPKKSHQVLFASLPDFSDNSKALFNYLLCEDISDYNLVWTVDDKELATRLNSLGFDACIQKSFKGFVQFFRSKYLIVTHGQYAGLKSKNQLLIDLWHGTPLKAMAFASDLSTKSELLKSENGANARDILIATSTVAKNALASCFYINPRKIRITGQPRNDMLFYPDAKKKLSKLLNIDVEEFKTFILFCPTFRKSDVMTPGRVEGKPKTIDIFDFEDYDIQEFMDFLENSNTLFLFKLHQFEERAYLSQFGEAYRNKKNIRMITTKMLKINLLDIYEILNAMDILVTDYSSIYFDFLLLNRPIIFTPTDLEEYSKTRGFVLEPYDFWAPGPKIVKFADFLKELKKCIENRRYYENERLLIKNIINTYQDNKSCERVLKVMEEIGKR